jgi:hypothetical protein
MTHTKRTLCFFFIFFSQISNAGDKVVVDVDVDWKGFGGRDLIPNHRKIS